VKREKKLTKKERKALKGPTASHTHEEQHIHCVACGRHIEPAEMEGSTPSAVRLRCQHGGTWAACSGCGARGRELLAVHDRTGTPVQAAAAWH